MTMPEPLRCFAYIPAAIALALVLVPASSCLGQDPPEVKPAELVRNLLDLVRTKADERRIHSAADRVVAAGAAAETALLERIQERSHSEILWTLRALKNIPVEAGKPIVLSLASHGNADIRAEALGIGAQQFPESFASLFAQRAADPDPEVRKAAYNGLAAIEPRSEHLPVIIDGLVSNDFWIAMQAEQILARWPAPAQDEPDPLASGLHRVIARMQPSRVIPLLHIVKMRGSREFDSLLLQGSEKGSDDLRASLLKAAATHRSRALMERARNNLLIPTPPSVKIESLAYLAVLKDDSNLPAMAGLLTAADPKVREQAAIALRRITGQVFGYDAAAWQRWFDSRP